MAKETNWDVLNNEMSARDATVTCFAGYDHAVVGAICNGDGEWTSVYSRGLIIRQLESDGMTHDEANEFYDFNVLGSIMSGGPVILDLYITGGELIE